MPFYDRIAVALGLQQPKAYNRYTRDPVLFQDTPDVGMGAGGAFDYLTNVMEVATQASPEHRKRVLNHETAHSLFNSANPTSTPVKILQSFFGSDVAPMLKELQKQAPSDSVRKLKPREFEHAVIDALDGTRPFIANDLAKGHILDAINNFPTTNEAEKNTIEKLNQVFKNRRK